MDKIRLVPGESFSPYSNSIVPWPWMRKTVPLRGTALAVGMVLWFWVRKEGKMAFQEEVRHFAGWGLSRDQIRRGLDRLEKHHLVYLHRLKGTYSFIRVLEVNEQENENPQNLMEGAETVDAGGHL